MNRKLRDILKYFFLTFLSLEVMYFIAKSQFNFLLVLIVAVCFTVLYSLDKLKLPEKLAASHTLSKGIVNKDKAL